jgi:predicted anti-sigma-YlaC factor YlaD
MTKECETICDLLVDYGDGELAADDDRRVGAHLESCADCRAELRLLQRSLDVARTVWEEAASGAETQVGWAERGESHQDLVEAKLVGLPLLVPPYESLPSHRAGRRWRFAAAALAGAIIIALVTLPWLVPHGGAHVATRLPTGPNRLATGNVSDPAAMSVEEIERYIAREASAARLCATAELLGTQPGLEAERQRAEQYIIENYGDTTAGRKLLARAASKPTKEPQS